jgi:uncharacterized protein (DUF58 family)
MKIISIRRVPSLFITSIMVVAVSLFLFLGLLNRQYDLTVLSIFILGTAVTLKIWTKIAAKNIIYHLDADRTRFFPEEIVTLSVSVENYKPLPVWVEIAAPTDGPQYALVHSHQPFTGQQTLLWYQSARFHWQFTAPRRGIYKIGPLQVASGDLLGFFQNESESNEELEVVVYPRIVLLAPFNLPKREFFGIPGGESPVDDPVYILGTSDYHYGRPARYIHWKASARHQRLQEKVFDSSVQEKILFLVDSEGFVEFNGEESFELGLEVIASLAMQFDRRGCAIGLLTNSVVSGSSSSVAISRNPQQLSAILEALARIRLECREGFVNTIKTSGAVPWGTTCVCLTFNEDTGSGILVEYLKRWKTPVVMLTSERVSLLRENDPFMKKPHISSREQDPIKEARPL